MLVHSRITTTKIRPGNQENLLLRRLFSLVFDIATPFFMRRCFDDLLVERLFILGIVDMLSIKKHNYSNILINNKN